MSAETTISVQNGEYL